MNVLHTVPLEIFRSGRGGVCVFFENRKWTSVLYSDQSENFQEDQNVDTMSRTFSSKRKSGQFIQRRLGSFTKIYMLPTVRIFICTTEKKTFYDNKFITVKETVTVTAHLILQSDTRSLFNLVLRGLWRSRKLSGLNGR